MKQIYLIFIHKSGENSKYGGVFDTRDRAKWVCDEWNKTHDAETDGFADFINVTDEVNNAYILM